MNTMMNIYLHLCHFYCLHTAAFVIICVGLE